MYSCSFSVHLLMGYFCFHIVGARDQTWSSGEGHEDQDPGGDLPVFSAHQGKVG